MKDLRVNKQNASLLEYISEGKGKTTIQMQKRRKHFELLKSTAGCSHLVYDATQAAFPPNRHS